MQTPLVKMFAILADLANGVAKSAFAISGELEIALSTTWRLLHKVPDFLANAIDETMTSKSTAVGVPSQFSGIEQMLYQAGDGKIVAATIQFIVDIFDGVSRKYSQKYAAQFAFINRGGCTFEALLRACICRDPISDHDIASYSSPEYLNLPALLYPRSSKL
ncbi:MAG: hypothetical protein ABSE82_15890 [Nitrososphaerales archaeon]